MRLAAASQLLFLELKLFRIAPNKAIIVALLQDNFCYFSTKTFVSAHWKCSNEYLQNIFWCKNNKKIKMSSSGPIVTAKLLIRSFCIHQNY